MQEIKLAKTAGFCFGVNRAVDLVYSILEEGKTVYTLGPIIHNPQVVADLERRGVVIVEEIGAVPQGAVIVVRTHGVPAAVIQAIQDKGLECCDATCPFVSKIHKIVAKQSDRGDVVLIAGDPAHPEVRGIRGHCPGESYVFNSVGQLEKLLHTHPEFSHKSISAVAQTTFNIKVWENCVKKLNLVCTNATVFDTICNATQERQEEAIALSHTCGAMVIIGGRQSSNTAKLRDVCARNCPTFLIETAKELSGIDFSSYSSIGVTAGASTPAGIIKEVLETMSELLNENPELVEEKAETAAPAEEAAAEQPAQEEAPAEKSFDEMSFSEALEASLQSMNTDQKVKGTVVGMSPSEIQVDIGRKHAGYIPLDEFSADPTVNPLEVVKVGDVLDLIIMKTNDAEGTVMLSKKRFDAIQAWDDVVKASEDESVLEGVVTDVIKGGVLASTNGVRVFIPASLATASRGEPLEGLLHQHVKFRIIEVNKSRRRAVGSIRAVLKEERKAAEDAFWAQAEVGQVYTGTVRTIVSYGAFVDIGGVDGMVHISELSWNRIKNPSEVVSVGDQIEVYIKALDPEKRKISLGYKKVEDNPWEILRRDYPIGSEVTAKVVGMTAFGAFAQIIPGIDGLIHISQIADHRIEKPQDVLSIGEEVRVKITDIDFDKKRVSLSIRALLKDAQEINED
ncbi:MAG: bifunctional 4-hydroxy-3-methylbut-2-enyl diphosphate reductase/30S ribosomal protein S1 [Candidatus Fimivicinus sp.]|nr:bifunctional 4-hydroxy-3-methylbut-2-enyl diphosphate reductase/30S ribosomal protein S1 [Oscillospiraceae bacterium]MDY5590139.1 bifunctional 4-hydroxy-3-methylbut-2-enyl diphosphate reductase/30S ribosomal protein S1 [Candidatus Fimivicinus sp.]